MQFDFQSAIAIAIVAVATIYLARRAWRIFKNKSGGCGSCSFGGCSSKKSEPLVQLELGAKKPRQ